MLQLTIIRAQGNDSILKKAVGHDWKGKLSPVLYVLAIVAALRFAWIAQGIFVVAALIWLIPDRRIKNVLQHNHSSYSIKNQQADVTTHWAVLSYPRQE